MSFSGISQITMFIISILLVVLFIQPSLGEIKTVQDDIFEYSDAYDKISELNSELQRLVAESNSIRQSDMVALEAFLPSTSDSLQVMADISAIAEVSNLSIASLSSEESAGQTQDIQFEGEVVTAETVRSTDYSVGLTGTYEDFKAFLAAIENNKYIMEVAELTFGEAVSESASNEEVVGTVGAGEIAYTLTIRTYTLAYEYGVNTNATNEFDDPLLEDPII